MRKPLCDTSSGVGLDSGGCDRRAPPGGASATLPKAIGAERWE